jgi:tetratricopeptide (TPR) repeat protein
MENRRAATYLEPVARAVHEAHTQGILHRDLKPQNILVDKKTDRALVADFGLAKLTEGGEELTRAGEIMGTPSYMSPEQAKDSARVTAKTDIYALGATLYHMLTARPPFQAATPIETLRQVIDEEPAPPTQLNPSIDRDLETICVKCLHKEPSRRYDTAEALADDLQRYLAGEPIQARPIGTLGRIWRWCLRKPGLATAIAVAATFLVVGSVVSTFLWLETRAALQKSEERLGLAVATVDDFLTLVGEETLLNEPGMQPLRRKLLAKARDYYQQFLAEHGDDQTILDKVALAHFRVGLVTDKIDSPERALVSFRRARDMQQQLLNEWPHDQDCLQNLGNTSTAMGGSFNRQGKLNEARKAHLEAIAVRKQAADQARPDESEFARMLANSYMNVGIIEMNLGLIETSDDEVSRHFEEARRRLEEAQAVRQDVLMRIADCPKTRRDLGKGYFSLGCLAMAKVEAEPAEKSLKDAIEVFTTLLEEDSKVLANQSDLATSYRVLGDLKSYLGVPDSARRSYQEALAQMDRLVRENSAVPSYRAALASLYMSLGQLECDQDLPQAAGEAFQQAREILEPLADGYREVPQYRHKLAVTLQQMAQLRLSAGEPQAAREDLIVARNHLAELVGDFPNNVEFQTQLEQTKAALDALPAGQPPVQPQDE